MHGIMRMGKKRKKKENVKVRNYNLRDLDSEMNKKAWNVSEISE